MMKGTRALATDTLPDQRLFVLAAEQYDYVIRMLDAPPTPGPKLRALMHRTPAWDS